MFVKNVNACPVDFATVNEAQPRLVAAQAAILAAIYAASGFWLIPAFLIIDFFLRGFRLGKYSPLGKTASLLVNRLHLRGKAVDQAPKRFAAKLGFILSLVILALYLLGQVRASFYAAYVLILFALLESVFSLCVGCQIYSLGLKLGIFKR